MNGKKKAVFLDRDGVREERFADLKMNDIRNVASYLRGRRCGRGRKGVRKNEK